MQKSRVNIIIGKNYILINDLDTHGKIIEEIMLKAPIDMECQFCSPCG